MSNNTFTFVAAHSEDGGWFILKVPEELAHAFAILLDNNFSPSADAPNQWGVYKVECESWWNGRDPRDVKLDPLWEYGIKAYYPLWIPSENK